MFKYALLCILLYLSHAQGHEVNELQLIVDDYCDWFLEQFPEFATQIGVYTWNRETANYTLSDMTNRREAVVGFLGRLEAIREQRDNLNRNEKVTYDVLKYALQTFDDGYTFHRSPQPMNPISFMEGPHLESESLMKNFPFRGIDDYLDYISRISKTKTQIEDIIELSRAAIQTGATLHNVSLTRVPGQIDLILKHNATDFILYEPFKSRLENMAAISEADKEELRSRAIRVINEDYFDSFRELKTFIEQEYLPNTRTTYSANWMGDLYPACLKWHLTVEETPARIHQMGLEEVDRISGKMREVIMRTGMEDTSIRDYLQLLKENPQYQMSSAEEILDTYTSMIFERINPHLTKMFENIPDYPVEVRTDPFGGGGSYSWVSEDGSKPGIFWANTFAPNETFSFNMMALTAHEVNPGHHLQTSYALKQPSPPFRKYVPYVIYSAPFNFPAYTSYTEGWALYAESLVEEMGLYEDDAELMGRYSSEIFRACRLVVDTGIHAMDWSREEAIEYMLRYTSFSRRAMEREIDRYITWPGQACAYKYGELKIKQLRTHAETELGALFDIKEFHSTILNIGRVPLNIMERAVDEMILNRLYLQTSATPQGTTSSLCLLTVTLSALAFGLISF